MGGSRHDNSRGANGRLLPERSGNAGGKRPDKRQPTTLLQAVLREGEEEALARVVIEKALAGDAAAARLVLERLEPTPRGRPIRLDLPAGVSSAGEVVALFDATLRALTKGEITPREAVVIGRVIEKGVRVLRACQREEEEARANARAAGPLAPSSSPLGERSKVRGSGSASVLPGDTARAATPPHPNLSPRGEGSASAGETGGGVAGGDKLGDAVRDPAATVH
jgi:hypothetical protein